MPAGSGKTTLVSSYVQARKTPCLWYRMDEGDSDLATFFYYLGLGAKQIAPRFRKPLPLLTPEYLKGTRIFALRFCENLFGRLKKPAILVFDNYHLVPEQSPFHDVLSEAWGAIPEGVNVILISRHAFPPSLTGLHANGALNRIEWNDLRLTAEETEAIARLRLPQLRQKAIKQLHLSADGWVGGLVLMLESMKAEISPDSSGKLSHPVPSPIAGIPRNACPHNHEAR
jgi:LuxR family transcriptional regulator, maltose regulon positive regulatory protein